jgi:hypothetical protein
MEPPHSKARAGDRASDSKHLRGRMSYRGPHLAHRHPYHFSLSTERARLLEPAPMDRIELRWICAWATIATAPSLAHAAPPPVVIARCGDTTIDVAGAGAHGTIVTAAGERWRFTANVAMARFGANTRTVAVEDVRTIERRPARPAPSALMVDLLLSDKKLVVRHASEGGADPDYAVDVAHCSFDGDAAIAALVPPPSEPRGCGPDVARDREAQALCEDHQKTLDARDRLEEAISDRAARDRAAARGAAVMAAEARRMKTWNRIDACLAADPAKGRGVAALHDAEAKTRACYARIAAKP